MLKPVSFTNDGSTAFLSGPLATVSFGELASAGVGLYHKPVNTDSKPYSFWGADNKRPHTIINAVSKNVVAASALQWLVDAFYGGGLVTYKRDIVDGKESLNRVDFPEFEQFKIDNIFDSVVEAALTDQVYFKMPVLEFYLGRGKYAKKIVQVNALDAASCRWGKMDAKKRVVSGMYYSAQFPDPLSYEIDSTFVYDRLNPYANLKFVLPPSYMGPGRFVYPWAPWHSIVDSGWLDISNNIPTVKANLLKNNMSIKYHIKIPKTYWSDKYKNWDKQTPDEQRKLRQTEMENMNSFLTGKENVMKAFFSHYTVGRDGKAMPGWEITKIDNAITDGTLSTDQSEANAMILFALNIDPTLKGAGLPNTKNSSGSGSDKREAKEIFISNLGLARRRFLNWVYFIRDFNQWDASMEFGFRDTILTTLDKNPTGTQKTLSA